MTVAIAASCEEGVVLVSDSMTWRAAPGGLMAVLGPKGTLIAGDRWLAAVAASGCFVGGYERIQELCCAYIRVGFEAMVDQLFADLVEAEAESRVAGRSSGLTSSDEPHDTTPALIVAGGPFGGKFGATLVTPGARRNAGWLGIGGCGRAIALGLVGTTVPDSVDAIARLAVEAARSHVNQHYGGRTLAEFTEQERRLPGCAFPLRVTKLMLNGATIEEVPA